jgi:hypothetical protein
MILMRQDVVFVTNDCLLRCLLLYVAVEEHSVESIELQWTINATSISRKRTGEIFKKRTLQCSVPKLTRFENGELVFTIGTLGSESVSFCFQVKTKTWLVYPIIPGILKDFY